MMGHKEAAQSIQSINGLAREYWKRPERLRDHLKNCEKTSPNRPNEVKHVAFFFHGLGIGGGERVTCRLAEILRNAGYETTILTNLPPCASGGQSLPKGVNHVQIPSYTEVNAQTYSRRSGALAETISTMHIDAVVFCQWFSEALPFDLLTTKACGALAYLYIQSSFSLFFLDANLPSDYAELPLTYSFADRVISLSDVDQLVWSSFNDNSVSTYNPPSEPLPEKLAPLNGHHVIWPARLHMDKCPGRVIPIMKELVKLVPDAVLHMVGPVEESYKDRFGSSIRDNDLANHILIEGPRSPESMIKLYMNSDAYLLTSKREGWSLALAEAMAAGLPCVIYDLPYLTLVQKNPSILRVPQGDAVEAANALARVLLNKTEAHERALEGRAVVEQIYSYDIDEFWNKCFTEDCAGIKPELPDQNNQIMWNELIRSYSEHLRAIEAEHADLIEELKNALTNIYNRDLELNGLKDELQQNQNEIAAIRNSISFKIGRLLTLLPRKLRAILTRLHLKSSN